MDGRFRWTQKDVDGAVLAVVALSQTVSLESLHRYDKEPGYTWLGLMVEGAMVDCVVFPIVLRLCLSLPDARSRHRGQCLSLCILW